MNILQYININDYILNQTGFLRYHMFKNIKPGFLRVSKLKVIKEKKS